MNGWWTSHRDLHVTIGRQALMRKKDSAQHGSVSTQPLALPPSSLVLGMLQVTGTSPMAARAVARAVSSLGEKPTKVKSLGAQAQLVLCDGGPVGWQGAGGGSKATTRAQQWKASSVGARQFCYWFQQSWDFSADGTHSYLRGAQLLLEAGVLPWFAVKNLGTGDSRQSTEQWWNRALFFHLYTNKSPIESSKTLSPLIEIYINTYKNLMYYSFSSMLSLDFNCLCGVQIQSVPSQFIFKAFFRHSYLNLFKALRFFSQLWKAKTERDRKVKDSFTILEPLKSILEI